MGTRTPTRTRAEQSPEPDVTTGETMFPPLPDTPLPLSSPSPVVSSPHTPADLQRHTLQGGPGEDSITVILHINGSDADGVRQFHERLPVSLVRALLDPSVENFFIPIKGDARMKPPRAKSHWLHTMYIREIVLLDKLPDLIEE